VTAQGLIDSANGQMASVSAGEAVEIRGTGITTIIDT
jgi:hypothetical protein